MKSLCCIACKFLACWLFLASFALAQQDDPPQFLGTVQARHQVWMANEQANYGVLWTTAGFGRINFTQDNLIVLYRSGQDYTMFRITNPGNGSMDDYWITTPQVWNQYLVDGNVATLRSQSRNFNTWIFSSNFVWPEPTEPITWEDRTADLTVGYTSTTTLLVVRRTDQNTWEWSVRGVGGRDQWITATSKDAAKQAAESSL